ncbi:DNA-binding response regulator [Reichenbachiella sp. 5M10]|uniref:LytR/AlgR family response regulator transcription factor n=1 Tax=Reichenbachiella sp. 5M10 TaxID=1889772 RepID=UPI000C1615A0|nr:LytTR family DNA-binding domain-containing protein [Reichenbachiella sp. 5M10]PIB34027.1 DNA-binding response regulator [Reichenbachiella sp. 5M10]
MKCIVIDDDQTARLILNQYCSELPVLNLVEEFPNAIQAIKYLNEQDVDLIFLDIHMPDFSGFDFIQTLKKTPRVILTTSDSSLALDAFEYDCIVDYLVKPIAFERFERAVEKVKQMRPQKEKTEQQQKATGHVDSGEMPGEFFVNIDRTLIKIETDSVKSIEGKGDYIYIKTTEKEYKVHSTLKKILEKLPDSMFLQVHRSHIINMTKIVDIEFNSIVIGEDVIPISRSKRPELMRRLNLL